MIDYLVMVIYQQAAALDDVDGLIADLDGDLDALEKELDEIGGELDPAHVCRSVTG